MVVFDTKHRIYGRRTAARKIQSAWRKRRSFKMRNKNFTRKVNKAVLSKEPMQYNIFGKQSALSQVPIVLASFSNLFFDRSSANQLYFRTSTKVKPYNLHLDFRFDAVDSPYNVITVALVRHKRSEEITNADLTPSAPATGALTNQNDKPFLPSTLAPNSSVANMTGISTQAHPEMLASLLNPKVVEVIWTKSVVLQPQWTQSDGRPAGNTYPMTKMLSKNIKFKPQIWKYQTQADGDTTATFPYNNKCYQILAWSDSVSGTSHPTVNMNTRLSFKDLD